MKQDYPHVGREVLCRLFGKTRHAYYDHLWRWKAGSLKDDVILQEIYALRKELPRLGTRKLLGMLKPILARHSIRIGRDYLFDLLADHRLLIRKRKRKIFTTNSRHWLRKYSNLIRQMMITGPEQLWVSDITYIRVVNHWGYLSLITDTYSKKIMGYGFRQDLSTQGCVDALKMALNNRIYPDQRLVHHSDRGCQYCSKEYVDLLVSAQIDISMTESGNPYDNPLAERMNGLIKEEFNLYESQESFELTSRRVARTIEVYNSLRPHGSCDDLTPNQAHLKSGELKKRWKNYRKNRSDQSHDAVRGVIENAGLINAVSFRT